MSNNEDFAFACLDYQGKGKGGVHFCFCSTKLFRMSVKAGNKTRFEHLY